MALNSVSVKNFTFPVFQQIGKGAILTAKNAKGEYNGMTVSWGGTGVLWGRQVMFFFVRPERHTFSLLTCGSIATLSFFPDEHAEILRFFGRTSGKNVDKAQECGLTPFMLPSGGISYLESTRVFSGKVLYGAPLTEEGIWEREILSFYKREGYHRFFVAEVSEIYENEG